MDNLIRIKGKRMQANKQCVVCDHQNAYEIYTYYFKGGESFILECIQCAHIFIHPIPLVSLASRNMDSLQDAELFGSTTLKFLYERMILQREINKAKKMINKAQPTLLDIGCGGGWTTSVWKKHGFDVTGLEPSATRSKLAHDHYHILVIQNHIEGFQPDKTYDVIILRHVLEHIEDPLNLLKKIKEWLSKDGILIIVIPNINSIGRYLFKEHWEWILPWHLHFFKPKTLVALAQRAGFQKACFYQTPSPLWYPASFGRIFNEGSKLGQYFRQAPSFIKLVPFLPLIFIGAIFNLNDSMTLFLRKNAQH